MMMKFIGPLLLAMVLTSACKSNQQVTKNTENKTVQSTEAASIDGRWHLQAVNGTAITMSTDEAFLEFSTTDSRFFGKAGCNNFSGAFQTESNTVSFGLIMATKMFCPNSSLEDQLLNLLTNSAWEVTTTSEQLHLNKGENKLSLVRAKQ